MSYESAQRAYDRMEPEQPDPRAERERQASIEWDIRTTRVLCTDVNLAEKWVCDWIADPTRVTAEIMRLVALYGDDEAELGGLIKRYVENHWRDVATFTTDRKE